MRSPRPATERRLICATGPGQHGDRMPGRGGHAPWPGCSRQPYSLAKRKNERSRAVSVPPVSIPRAFRDRLARPCGERGPGHGGARHAQPRGQDGAGHREMVQRRQRVMASSLPRAARTCSCISARSPAATAAWTKGRRPSSTSPRARRDPRQKTSGSPADVPPGTTSAPPEITAANGCYAAKGR